MASGDRSPTGTLERSQDTSPEQRLGEDRAQRILERAATLDAKRSSEIEVAELREAAAAAGISEEAFDQAIREDAGGLSVGRGASGAGVAPPPADVARYADVLKDLLGDDAQVVVVEGRIEARAGTGLTVSIDPSSRNVSAAILAEGSLRRRLSAIVLPIAIPVLFASMLVGAEEEAAIGVMLGAILAILGSGVATVVSHGRERKALRKKAERLRRQLQRMLGPVNEQD